MAEQFVDKYEVLETVGTGSMGVVYKAVDPEIGRVVAIKTLKSMYLGNDDAGVEALKRFKQESRSAGRLQHPNIVTIYSAGRTDNGSPYIVMEHIEGESLEEIISNKKHIDPLAAIHYLAQVASAIDYAHSQNVIHRDIKPSNVIVDSSHKPHLLDFGVAKLNDTSLTPAGTVVGTPSYMSPEQIRGEELSGKTDLFSFGVLAYEIFTTKRPFPGKDFTTVVGNIIHKDPLTFSDVQCTLPDELEKVLIKSLSKEKDERFDNALDFVKSIADVFSAEIDGSGLIGGYSSDLKLEDIVPRESSDVQEEESIETESVSEEVQDVDVSSEVLKGGVVLNIEEKTVSDETVRESTPYVPDADVPKKQNSKGIAGKVVFLLVCAFAVLWFVNQQIMISERDKAYEVVADLKPIVEPIENFAPQTTPKVEEIVPLVPTVVTKEIVSAADNAELNMLLATKTSKDELAIILEEVRTRSDSMFENELRKKTSNEDFMVRVNALKALSDPIFSNDKVFETASDRLVLDEEFLVRGFAAKLMYKINPEKAMPVFKEQVLIEKNDIVLKVLRKYLGK